MKLEFKLCNIDYGNRIAYIEIDKACLIFHMVITNAFNKSLYNYSASSNSSLAFSN